MATTEELLTVEEVADRLKVLPITIRRWLARGEITGFKTPAGWRFEEKDIQSWIDNHRTKEQPQ